MTRGLVIGKFYPFHKGHSYLIDYAMERSDEVTVLVCNSPEYSIPAHTRQKWIQHVHPEATVRIIPDIGNDDDSEAWARHTLAFLGYTPDVVFSSEDYGVTYAAYMKTSHHMVDKNRTHVPISGTRVRHDRIKHWGYLDHPTRADLAVRIVVVGAESTGTTTLSSGLAKALGVPWVPEYGRMYSEGMIHTKYVWSDDDFVHIATMQQMMERHMAAHSNGMIICDTNATATTIWQERYMNRSTEAVRVVASQDHADLYIVTSDDIPFVQDGTRDGESIRHAMHRRFIEYLKEADLSYCVVRGDQDTRLKTALSAVENLDLRIGRSV